MGERKRLLFLILILSVVSLSITGITIGILYNAAFEEAQANLVNIAQSRARIIEAIARYDNKHWQLYNNEFPDYDPFEATMSQITDAHSNFKGFGETGEFTLARRDGDEIDFLLRLRHGSVTSPENIFLGSELDGPTRLALSGESGIIVGLDYRGETVLAAYEPVAILDLGIVAKMDLSEVRAPFIRAGIIAVAVSIILIFFGALLFFKVTNPIIAYLKKYSKELEVEITERKLAEEALRESEEKYRNLLANISDVVMEIDSEGKFTYVSPQIFDMFGYSPDESIGLAAFDFVHPDDMEKCMKAMETMDKVKHIEYRSRHKEGHYVHVSTSGRLTPDGAGGLKVVSVLRDITDRKRAEEEIKAKSLFLESLILQLPLPTFVMDSKGFVLMVNEAFLKFYAVPNKELILGTNALTDPANIKHDVVKYFEEALKGKIVEIPEMEFLSPHAGKRVTTKCRLFPIFDTTGALTNVVAMQEDVTDSKRAKEDRKKLEVHLRHQQKLESIGTLASGVAHEINNPINGIMNYAQLISDRLDEDSPLKEFAAEIGKETERVAAIVRNLLTFSRQDKDTHSPANIQDIINGTLSLIQSIIRHDQIILELDIPGDLPTIRCRSQQIQQVLMNLLTNARDALNEKYPEYDDDKIMIIKVRPFEKENIKWLRMTVEDHGVGIPDEIRDRIFDPFFTSKDRTKGTGLGLSISYGIIEDHLGKIHVESEPGQHTRFHVDLRVNNGWTLESTNEEENKRGKA